MHPAPYHLNLLNKIYEGIFVKNSLPTNARNLLRFSKLPCPNERPKTVAIQAPFRIQVHHDYAIYLSIGILHIPLSCVMAVVGIPNILIPILYEVGVILSGFSWLHRTGVGKYSPRILAENRWIRHGESQFHDRYRYPVGCCVSCRRISAALMNDQCNVMHAISLPQRLWVHCDQGYQIVADQMTM